MTAIEAIPRLQAFYDSARKNYWIAGRDGGWLEINETSLKRHLKASGLAADTKRGEVISELEAAINEYQLEQSVAFAGPLSGCYRGIIEQGGQRILVTTSPKLIEAKPGSFPLLSGILENLLNDPVCDQRPYLFGWLKTAYQALQLRQRRPGQALVLAGPKNCGKSLLQNLITEILGGRSAKPYRYMAGLSQFNSDLFAAEHLMIEDESGSTDGRDRRKFGSKIKDFTVNDVQSCHAKGRDAISLKPFWRLSISVNDEPENLMVLPPLDENLSDKMMLLRARHAPMPFDENLPDGRAKFWDSLIAELPAFISYLTQMELPPELKCQRFGVTTYHHPELIEAIDDIAPEARLLSLIDAVVFADSPMAAPVITTSEALERDLINSAMGYEARRLFNWTQACGTYLGRLAKKKPSRVEQKRTNSSRDWILKPNS